MSRVGVLKECRQHWGLNKHDSCLMQVNEDVAAEGNVLMGQSSFAL